MPCIYTMYVYVYDCTLCCCVHTVHVDFSCSVIDTMVVVNSCLLLALVVTSCM